MNTLIIVLAAVVALLAVVSGASALLARRVVAYRPPKTVPARFNLDGAEGTVDLPDTPDTSAPGTYTLWYPGKRGHAQVGDVVERTSGRVTRTVLTSDDPPNSERDKIPVAWSGHVITDPSQLGQCTSTQLDTSRGPIQLWKIPPQAGGGATWAIHIHGIRSARTGVLRSVPAALAADMPSVVMSFAGEEGSGERQGVGAGLGAYEWRDVVAVMQYAVDQGAEQLVFFAWSMGASAAMLALERTPLKARVRALVLIDPATNWVRIIRHGVVQSNAPSWLSHLIVGALSTPGLAQLAGSPGPVKFDALDWTSHRRIDIPALVIHSAGDRTVPYELSTEFVHAQAPFAVLETFDPVPHCAEYNAEPERFSSVIVNWLATTPDRTRY